MGINRARSGEMRHPVTVQQKSSVRGTMGEITETWDDFAYLRCRIWPGKGSEAEESRRETGKVSTRFFTRFQPGITYGMRLVFNDRLFDIVSTANLGELGRELEITAIETI